MYPEHTSPTVEVYGDAPSLWFTPEAIQRTELYVQLCDDEIGWLGIVEDQGRDVYLCTEVLLLHQEVAGATTEIQPDGLVKFAEEVGLDKSEKVRLWGHSHVNMGTSASSQDDDQMKLFEDNGYDWFFRVIANKKGKMSVSLYNYAKGIIWHDLPWDVLMDIVVSKEDVAAEIEEKVTKLVSKVYTSKYDAYCNRAWDDYDGYVGGYYGGNVIPIPTAGVEDDDDDELILADADWLDYLFQHLLLIFTPNTLLMIGAGGISAEEDVELKELLSEFNITYDEMVLAVSDHFDMWYFGEEETTVGHGLQ